MKPVWIAALAVLAGCVQPAEDMPVGRGFAQWGETTGSLPPEFSYDYVVTFGQDQRITVVYCKGYADTAPGCATVSAPISDAEFAALTTALDPLSQDMAANPPQRSAEIMVGGGSIFGTLTREGQEIILPGTPIDADVARVFEVINLLRSFTPTDLIDDAAARARNP